MAITDEQFDKAWNVWRDNAHPSYKAALRAALETLEPLKILAADWSDCPNDFQSARINWKEKAEQKDARIAELEAENAGLRTLLLNLADAADGVGIKHFDTDSFSDEVEEMRLSTLAAREELKKPAPL